MRKHLVSFIVFLSIATQAESGVEDAPFFQETVTRYSLDQLDSTIIRQVVVDGSGQLWVLTDSSLFVLSEDRFQPMDNRFTGALEFPSPPGLRFCGVPGNAGALFFADNDGFVRYSPGSRAVKQSFDFGVVHDLCANAQGNVLIAGDAGLFYLPRAAQQPVKLEQFDEPVFCVAWQGEKVVASTKDRMEEVVLPNSGKPYTLKFEIHGHIDETPTALVYDAEGNAWIGNADCVNVWRNDKAFDRFDGVRGLPYNKILCAADGGNFGVWFGTEKGAVRYDGEWHYYYGPRWHLGESIHSIAVQPDGTAWLASDGGLSRIEFYEWTLARKAAHFEAMVHPRHDRHGLVSDVRLEIAGDVNSFVQHDNDNDGLWTSIYLAAQCFRYAVTKSPDVKANAWKHFEAMEKLESITGIPGFVARSYVAKDEGHGAGEWHESADGNWVWKADTSSDELVGHYFVYPLVYDLVCETDEEKARVKELISRITNYILDCGYNLNDIDGKPTRWGVWSPEKLNHDPEWSIERGLNSLQMLAFLSAAYVITGEERFETSRKELIEEHHYHINMINQKIEMPSENNHSDDELAFLPYYTLFRYAKPVLPEYRLSIDRAWKIEAPEKSSLWNFIYGSIGVEAFGLQDAVWHLREHPLELVAYDTPNSHRLDIRISPDLDRFDRAQSVDVLPPDERRIMRWNGNPYELDDGGGGRQAHDPGAWLLAYWMGRYYEFIE